MAISRAFEKLMEDLQDQRPARPTGHETGMSVLVGLAGLLTNFLRVQETEIVQANNAMVVPGGGGGGSKQTPKKNKSQHTYRKLMQRTPSPKPTNPQIPPPNNKFSKTAPAII